VIQDDNETEMQSTEESIRAQLAAQYEITMMRMEQQKLGKALQIENKLKSMERHNEELARHNQSLQAQVAQQVQIIQRQQMAQAQLQQQATQAQAQVQAVQAVSAHGILRRHSSAISAMSALTASTTDEVDEPMYTMGGGFSVGSPSEGVQMGQFVGTPRTPRTPRGVTTPRGREESVCDMEMSAKYRRGRSKGRKMSEREIEARLLREDKEVQRVTGDGLSAWDRFLDLMTPAFCSCAPAAHGGKGKVNVRKRVKTVD